MSVVCFRGFISCGLREEVLSQERLQRNVFSDKHCVLNMCEKK